MALFHGYERSAVTQLHELPVAIPPIPPFPMDSHMWKRISMGRLLRGLIQQANRNEAGYAYDGAQFCKKLCGEIISRVVTLGDCALLIATPSYGECLD
jgi:hypothetical protein